jgi:hypothetical protein
MNRDTLNKLSQEEFKLSYDDLTPKRKVIIFERYHGLEAVPHKITFIRGGWYNKDGIFFEYQGEERLINAYSKTKEGLFEKIILRISDLNIDDWKLLTPEQLSTLIVEMTLEPYSFYEYMGGEACVWVDTDKSIKLYVLNPDAKEEWGEPIEVTPEMVNQFGTPLVRSQIIRKLTDYLHSLGLPHRENVMAMGADGETFKLKELSFKFNSQGWIIYGFMNTGGLRIMMSSKYPPKKQDLGLPIIHDIRGVDTGDEIVYGNDFTLPKILLETQFFLKLTAFKIMGSSGRTILVTSEHLEMIYHYMKENHPCGYFLEPKN